MSNPLVYGEPLSVLVAALKPFVDNSYIDDDGMWCSQCTLEPELGEPLERALLRAEAALLLHDATHCGDNDYEKRTPDQRRADALVELAQMMAAAASLLAVERR